MKRILSVLLVLSLSPIFATVSTGATTILDTQNKVANCIQKKTTKSAECKSSIAALKAWKANNTTDEVTKATTTMLLCMLNASGTPKCLQAGQVVLKYNKMQSVYFQSKTNVASVATMLSAGIKGNLIKVNNKVYRKAGVAPLATGSIITTSSGNFTLPATVSVYLTFTASKAKFCVSETTPDKKITWVATDSNPSPVSGKACSKA